MSNQNSKDEPAAETSVPKPHTRLPKLLRIALVVIGTALVLSGLFALYAYTATPGIIRKPTFQHYHFRMQILVDGKPVNFAEKEFQTETAKDVCSAQLTKQPIHFHDAKDQIVHIHWDGMTGGLVLKYYGWNYYGGLHGTLGFRFDSFPKLINVPIHGNTLPAVPPGDTFYVFTGDAGHYRERTFNDFVHKDLEDFFGKKSNLPSSENTGFLGVLFPKAYAHEAEIASGGNVSDQELQRLNNLIGNVVIFVQKDHPSVQNVQDRFHKLAPLPLSTCAG